MHRIGKDIQLSASDLVGHLNCGHLTALDRLVADGALKKPYVWDPLLEILQQRGAQHEAAYVDHLRASGLAVTLIEGTGIDRQAMAATLGAMRAGAPVIVQAALRIAPFAGRADILRRIEVPSKLGAWSYEVIDTKLARETKGGTVLQLCLYSDLLAEVQGLKPEFAYVVAPLTEFRPEQFRLSDYAAYFRYVRSRLQAALDAGENVYPEPVPYCDICRWRRQCDQRRHEDDHLSLVAGISATQRNELERRGVATMTALAELALPLPWKPDRGATSSYVRIREQARIQMMGRAHGKLLHERLPVEPGFGLCRLPEPDHGDVFFDLEGDPFVGEGGREYLFGYAFRTGSSELSYVADWCFTPAQEKEAFERFIDFVAERRQHHPNLHVYHYAPYEPGALKRLMGRYATREEQVDALLRGQILVDLYGVVRHAVRASVESYSIKKLEPLFGFVRGVALQDANHALSKVQACLELGDPAGITQADREVVTGYNRDDCLSTASLRDWLEGLRAGAISDGAAVPRPALVPEEATPELTARQARIEALAARLMDDIPVDAAQRTAAQHGQYVLANLLDWHRREKKATWWEYFRLAGLSVEELFDERAAISGLTFKEAVGGTAKAPVHRYQFPAQEAEFRGGEDLRSVGGGKFGKVVEVDLENRLIDVKKRGDTAAVHPGAVFEHGDVDSKVLAESLVRIGEHVALHGISGSGPFKAARDLLQRLPPDVGGAPLRRPDEAIAAAACRLVTALDGVLPIQGPPGAGKTYTGGRMIVEQVRAGRRVGVTANSHKVIRNLLDAAIEEAARQGIDLRCVHKVAEKIPDTAHISFSTDNAQALGAIGRDAHVVAGTGWLWSRPDAVGAVDVLFIDEAAQMSLANVLAISPAATGLVLLGDPQQLEQPMQGTHPEGADVSALEHLLAGLQTIGEEEGLFLDQTWRLHPSICAYTSELFYEGRLHPRPGLENQSILMDGPFGGAGLRYIPVPHAGNQSVSPQEADRVGKVVEEILNAGARWRDREGVEAQLKLEDILIIAPYNAQVFEIQDRLPGARVGTVDKFQGQEAPIVIYSVTTSSYADAPRGMEFLYSANRLNVATSRAKCLCIVVASPSVFEPDCRTPRQMQLANAFCRYLEMATVLNGQLVTNLTQEGREFAQ
ncbi:TM0106 family RecB-like putative nuclease [Bradyrhizobium sp. Arg314]